MRVLHRGLDHKRVEWARTHDPEPETNLEIAFAEAWEEENEPRSWLNHGEGVLQDLLYDGMMFKHKVTRQEAAIAATAIQWLGTNCGRSWLETTLKKAGHRLLYPREVDNEEIMASRERKVREREAAVHAREQSVRDREFEVISRGNRVVERELEHKDNVVAWIAIMLCCNVGTFLGTFRRTGEKRRQRQINLTE